MSWYTLHVLVHDYSGRVVCPGIHCMSWYTLHDYSGRVVCPGIHCMSWYTLHDYSGRVVWESVRLSLSLLRTAAHLHWSSDKRLQSPVMLPARSSSTILKVAILPSAARPLSRHLPRMAVSMLPPHSITTTLYVHRAAFSSRYKNHYNNVLPTAFDGLGYLYLYPLVNAKYNYNYTCTMY